MSFEITNLNEVINQAVQYGDLSPTESVVKEPANYKAYAFIGANHGQVFCVFVAKQFATQIEGLFNASYEALKQVRSSMGRNAEAKNRLADTEEEFMLFADMLPIIEMGASKSFGDFNDLPMFYGF